MTAERERRIQLSREATIGNRDAAIVVFWMTVSAVFLLIASLFHSHQWTKAAIGSGAIGVLIIAFALDVYVTRRRITVAKLFMMEPAVMRPVRVTPSPLRAIVESDGDTELVEVESQAGIENWQRLADFLQSNDISRATRANVKPTSGAAFAAMKEDLQRLGLVPGAGQIRDATDAAAVMRAARQMASGRPIVIRSDSPQHPPAAPLPSGDDGRRRQIAPSRTYSEELRARVGELPTWVQMLLMLLAGCVALYGLYAYFPMRNHAASPVFALTARTMSTSGNLAVTFADDTPLHAAPIGSSSGECRYKDKLFFLDVLDVDSGKLSCQMTDWGSAMCYPDDEVIGMYAVTVAVSTDEPITVQHVRTHNEFCDAEESIEVFKTYETP